MQAKFSVCSCWKREAVSLPNQDIWQLGQTFKIKLTSHILTYYDFRTVNSVVTLSQVSFVQAPKALGQVQKKNKLWVKITQFSPDIIT